MAYSIWIVTPPADVHRHTRCFDEIALSLQAAFRTLGHDVPIVYTPGEARGTTIVLGSGVLYEITDPLPAEMIIYNFEQVHDEARFFRQGYPYIDYLRRWPVWDYSRNNIEALQQRGIENITLCGVGYMPELTRIERKKRKDIDVLFIGTPHPRRQRILDELSRRGLKVEHLRHTYGAERDAMIARSKLVLNIHLQPAHIFEIVRVSYLLANRVCVISEVGSDVQLEAPFKSAVVFRPYEELVETCVKYAADAAKRRKQSEAGFRIFSKMPQVPMLLAALQPDGGLRMTDDKVDSRSSVIRHLPSIFVNIPSYRDPECQWTVKDLFEKAAQPERIRVGICWQYDPGEDRGCFAVDHPRPDQVRVIQYHSRDSQGANWARAQAFTLWQGEEYVLQIDSHMRFEPGWDELLLDALKHCPGDKALLTAWLPGYKPPDILESDSGKIERLRIRSLGIGNEAQLINLNRSYAPVAKVNGRMEPACSCAAGCIFGPAAAFKEVPFDPYIDFWGDEINQSARWWTHGWDFYQLDRRALYHYWDPDNIRGRNEYRDRKHARHQRARARNLHLFGIKPSGDAAAIAELEKYPLGAARTIGEYWQFMGVDFATNTIMPHAAKGEWNLMSARRDADRGSYDLTPLDRNAGNASIFVNIASHRDPECRWTLKDLFSKAAHPERIRVGICQQADPVEDKACMVDSTIRPGQIHIKQVHPQESHGANWARHEAQRFWNGEDYVLQIDSHMRFEPGWDDALVDMLNRCPSEKPVLCAYLPNYDPPDHRNYGDGHLLRIRVRRFGDNNDPQLLHITGAFIRRDDARAGLYPSPFYVANFMFARAQTLKEVPIDPHIHFYGDEISYAARLWTHGWDIFQPDRIVMFHYWVRKDSLPKQYYRNIRSEKNRRGFQRVRHLLGFEAAIDPAAIIEIDRYGLGNARPLRGLWAFAGIDWQKRTIVKDALEGKWTVSLRQDARHLPSIFINIASYRDRECQWTVKDLFEKAAHPERIFVGICWQFDAEQDKDCFQVSTRPEQVRMRMVDWREANGVCWARHQAQQLWDGEDYTLMIDAHMRFMPGWDEQLIEELSLCDSKKPVLSGYVPHYTPPHNLSKDQKVDVCVMNPFMADGNIRGRGLYCGFKPEKPLRGAFLTANFVFSRADIIREVPYDPYLYFDQEEISYAARLYTHGWDVFTSRQPLLYHYYNNLEAPGGSVRPLHWSDLNKEHSDKFNRLQKDGLKRFNHMTGYEPSDDRETTRELDRFGFGKARTLAEFEAFSGVDFKHKTTSDIALQGLFIEELRRTRLNGAAAAHSPAIVQDSGRSSIFVNIASYRDRECQWTVKDLFEKAAHPERIHVGICWQFDAQQDQDCFMESTRTEQVRLLPVDWREAEGVCWARHQAQQLWDGETYNLQIDAHMRFVPGWDELMIEELHRCESDKAVLSCALGIYTPPDKLQTELRPAVRRVRPFQPDGNIRGQAEYIELVPEKPLNGAFITAGFLFSKGDVVSEVPYDPYLYFDQEEITYAARLYTHGWDVFSSRTPFMYHYYNDLKAPGGSVRPLHWADMRKEDSQKIRYLQNRGLKRFNHLTGYLLSGEEDITKELDKYGLGRARSLKQFEEYSGVDFKRKIASEKALRCLFIKDIHKYTKGIHIPELDSRDSLRQKTDMAPSRPPLLAASLPQRVANNAPMLEKGDFIPMFELTDTDRKTRSVEIYGGQHCMLFFLPAGNAGYVAEFFNHLQRRFADARHKNIWQLFVLDDSVDNLIALKQKIGTPHTLLADPDRKLAQAFGLCLPQSDAIPAGYVLNTNLRIVHRSFNVGAEQLAASIVEHGQAELENHLGRNREPRVISEMAPALIIPHAFTPELCRKCIDAFHHGHTFEGTVGAEDKTGYRPSAKVRTDHIISGSLLDEIDEKLSRSVFPEIKKIFGLTVMHRELYKVGVYKGEKAGFFKAHRDNFENPLAYRRVAMTLQLNDGYEGGGLRFPEYGHDIYRPAMGSAIAFSCATVHEALPVTGGERYILVCFFHGEEEEAFRRHYLAGKGVPLRVQEHAARLRPPPEVAQSRDYYEEWRKKAIRFDGQGNK